jgi:hypothetical protein
MAFRHVSWRQFTSEQSVLRARGRRKSPPAHLAVGWRTVAGTIAGIMCCGLVVCWSPSMATAADASAAILKPADAGPDFAIQGEYVGSITDDGMELKFGVQIISLGDGQFRAVGYPGGLPGDGYAGGEKVFSEGMLRNGAAVFETDQAVASVKDDKIVVSIGGLVAGQLNKVNRKSPTLEQKPPAEAVVLFDGTSADRFENGKLDEAMQLIQGVTSKDKFQSGTLHLEFLLSYMPAARDQGRANSGCYLQGRYEVQILDSFGLEGRNNECGGIYGIRDPDVNMCFPPLTWQTYDIDFTAAKYDDAGKKTDNARMTVRHNGVVIHRNVAVGRGTTAAPVAEGPEPGPVYLQDHGNPIRFRNIWFAPKP